MANGDGSFRVVEHPSVGKTLVAERDLPKGYVVGWWGKRTDKMPPKKIDWALETSKGVIDATDFPGSLLQFCPCPGPDELPVIQFAFQSERFLDKSPRCCVLFQLKEMVPKNTQITMMYCANRAESKEFFADRNIEWENVATKKYPAKKKPKQ